MTNALPPLSPRTRTVLLDVLRSGGVPQRGLEHLEVGRAAETRALVGKLDELADGCSWSRLVVGAYGAGKTFHLTKARVLARHKRLVTMHADLGPERRLAGSDGRVVALHRALVASLSTLARPDGGGLDALLERVADRIDAGESGLLAQVAVRPGGADVAQVVRAWAEARRDGDALRRELAERWLRGELHRVGEALPLGVRAIVDDRNAWSILRALAALVRCAGFGGLLVCIDECGHLLHVAHKASREANLHQMLTVLNDLMAGADPGLGVLFGMTPEFLEDPRRGVYSYGALETRLRPPSFVTEVHRDLTGPVWRLASFDRTDARLLLQRLRRIEAGGDEPARQRLDDAGLERFETWLYARVGAERFLQPRELVRHFLALLGLLEQNPGLSVDDALGQVAVREEPSSATADDDAFVALAGGR